MRLMLTTIATLAVAGCAAAGETAPDRTPLTAVCRADALATFQGKPATQELGSQMLAATGATQLRWVPQGTMVTMIYVAGRVTVFLDEQNRVRSASCS